MDEKKQNKRKSPKEVSGVAEFHSVGRITYSVTLSSGTVVTSPNNYPSDTLTLGRYGVTHN